jgi:invasion protein IalB
MTMTPTVVGIWLAVQVAGVAGQAQTQTQTQTPVKTAISLPMPNPGADMTTATFGDWMLRCRPNDLPATGKSCEVVQSVVVQGQTSPFAQLAFGRIAPGDPLMFTAVVPPNVTFPSLLKVAMDEKDTQPVEVSWARCLPGGCFANFAVPSDVLTRWRTKDEGGRIVFKNGAGQDMAVAISFRGLGRALDALAREK